MRVIGRGLSRHWAGPVRVIGRGLCAGGVLPLAPPIRVSAASPLNQGFRLSLETASFVPALDERAFGEFEATRTMMVKRTDLIPLR